MLRELTLRNFAIVQEARLSFEDGLNCITGETGAGKSIAVDALAFVLGARFGTEVIREGERAAYVEAVFDLPAGTQAPIQTALSEAGIEVEGELLVSREISAAGRSTGRINGRAVTQALLSEVGSSLADIHGQHEHLRVLKPQEQLRYLDRFAGLAAERGEVARLVDELRATRRRLAEVEEGARGRARRLDQLRHEVTEISAAALDPDEEEPLQAERRRLANAETLRLAAQEARAMLDEASGGPLGAAATVLSHAASLDELAKPLEEQALAIQSGLDDLLRSVRAYAEEVEADPERLQQVEERVHLIATLKRKYGATVDEILRYQREAEEELSELEHAEEDAAELEARETDLSAQTEAAAASLSGKRADAAKRLEEAVAQGLTAVEMPSARFLIAVRPKTSGEQVGVVRLVDRTGADEVEFLVSFNAGESPRPLAKVASGGETSRFMLALKTALGEADDTPLMVFDEVDAGLGGRSGAVIGRQLARLASGRQVLVITHLPQVAAFAATHWFVSKEEAEGRTRASACLLLGEARVRELAQMLGSPSDANLASARELLQAAQGA